MADISNSPPNPATAYPTINQNTRSRILMIIGFIFGIFLMRNILFKDYTSQTKDYLTSVGHADDIGKVIPKTRNERMTEMMEEQLEQLNQYNLLLKNVSLLITENDLLKNRLTILEADVQQLKSVSTLRGGGGSNTLTGLSPRRRRLHN